MNIQETNSQNSSSSLEQIQLQLLQTSALNNKALSRAIDVNSDSENKAVDSADSDAFSALKLKISQGKEAGRAEYLAQLKESVASGEYHVSSDDLAGALLADGAGMFLVS